jgi:hypothetical protein
MASSGVLSMRWVARVLTYGMGVAGLALAGLVWWACIIDPYQAHSVGWLVEYQYLRPQLLGGQWMPETPARIVGNRLAERKWEERRDAAKRRHEGRIARLARIQLPVEAPSDH